MQLSTPIANNAIILIFPSLAASNICPNADGKPETIPENISSDIPLPTPRSVICSPSHIIKIEPVTKVSVATKLKANPLSKASPWFASVTAKDVP
jgi:hypothetical protein